MNLYQLNYFKIIAETQNMTRASEIIGIAQPALSKSLVNLEKELGINLFDRVGRGIILNENGKILLHYSNKIAKTLSEAKSILNNNNTNNKKTIRLCLYSATALFPTIIRNFKDIYSDIQFKIIQNTNPDGVDEDFDIKISSVGLHQITPPNSTILLNEGICVAVSMLNPLSKYDLLSFNMIENKEFIALNNNRSWGKICEAVLNSSGIIIHPAMIVDNPITAFEFVKKDLGIMLIPQYTHGYNAEKSVKVIPIKELVDKRSMYIQLNYTDNVPEHISEFYDFVIKYFNDNYSY